MQKYEQLDLESQCDQDKENTTIRWNIGQLRIAVEVAQEEAESIGGGTATVDGIGYSTKGVNIYVEAKSGEIHDYGVIQNRDETTIRKRQTGDYINIALSVTSVPFKHISAAHKLALRTPEVPMYIVESHGIDDLPEEASTTLERTIEEWNKGQGQVLEPKLRDALIDEQAE